MKIFHVRDSAGVYGAEVMLLNLMQEQQKLGLSPLLCSIGDLNEKEKPLEVEAQSRKLEVIKIRIPRGLKLRSALKILHDARYHKADILHLHGYKDTILVGLLPRFLRGIPAIRTLHGWTSKTKLSRIWLYEKLDRFCLKRLDGIVSVNTNLVDQVKRFVKRAPVITIENGIPPLRFNKEQILQEEGELAEFCRDAFVVGGVGRFSKEKGFTYLVEAMSVLVAKRPELKLVLIGEGDQQKELERIIQEERLAQHVFFAGYKHDAARYLPIFDVFVLPSLTEGLPIVLLEAMQAGVPVVATRVGGVPDVLKNGEYGALVESGTGKALAQSVLQVIEHLDDAQLRAEKSKERALNQYSSARMAACYLKLYYSVSGAGDVPFSGAPRKDNSEKAAS
jgi:glycosyltransferase involved in cell wall biosynthesis